MKRADIQGSLVRILVTSRPGYLIDGQHRVMAHSHLLHELGHFLAHPQKAIIIIDGFDNFTRSKVRARSQVGSRRQISRPTSPRRKSASSTNKSNRKGGSSSSGGDDSGGGDGDGDSSISIVFIPIVIESKPTPKESNNNVKVKDLFIQELVKLPFAVLLSIISGAIGIVTGVILALLLYFLGFKP